MEEWAETYTYKDCESGGTDRMRLESAFESSWMDRMYGTTDKYDA